MSIIKKGRFGRLANIWTGTNYSFENFKYPNNINSNSLWQTTATLVIVREYADFYFYDKNYELKKT